MVTVVAKPQQRGLNDNGGSSTTPVAAQQQRRRLNNNGGGSTTMMAAPRQRRRLHTDWMAVCLKLDGC